jgi:N-acetylmuramoyl-L-alanine amidase
MRKKNWMRLGATSVGAIVLISGIAMASMGIKKHAEAAAVNGAYANGSPPILIDPGHGGEDGGAIGIDGTIEAGINLAIAQKLNSFLRALGYQTTMTRTTDVAIYDPGTSTLRAKKTSDLHNRYALMEAMPPNGLFVSIHQNHFTAEKYHGTQVFYSKNNPESSILAQDIQNRVVKFLQPNNTRKIKPSGTEIYLLYEATHPAVLVECGFLSNYAETQDLKNSGYQDMMAFAIAGGILDYTSSCDPKEIP